MTFTSPLLRAAGRFMSPGGGDGKLTILTYHRVLPEPDALLNRDQIDATKFATHMAAIADCFTVLSLPQALERLSAGTLPPRAVALTFDDGYQDNFTVALPILQRHRLTATFFVCTGYLNDGLMFNDIVTEALRRSTKSDLDLSWLGLGVQALSDMQGRRELAFKILGAVKYLPFTERELACARIWDMADPGQHRPRLMMTDDQVRELAAQGMTIGAHTHTHPILNQVSLEAAREDVEKNRRLLTELIGETPTIFAYPNGRPICDYGYQHVQLIKDLGFSAAVSTAWGIATKACDPYQLPRFAPWDTNPRHFIMRLLKNAVKGQRPTVAPRMASPDD